MVKASFLKLCQMQKKKSLMILVAGPYRSGTNDNPQLIAANVKAMTDAALEIYKIGHLPVLGEWFALPLIEAVASKKIGDDIFNKNISPGSCSTH